LLKVTLLGKVVPRCETTPKKAKTRMGAPSKIIIFYRNVSKRPKTPQNVHKRP
jgi:hypothetical protein